MPPGRTIVPCDASGNWSSSMAIEDMACGNRQPGAHRTQKKAYHKWVEKTLIYRYLYFDLQADYPHLLTIRL
jgi:hypothetical protein